MNSVEADTKQTNLCSIFLMQSSALLFSFSNVFSKFAAMKPFLSFEFVVLYACSLGIMFLYAILWQQILKRVSMIVAYSNRLVAMIWGVVWGCIIFGEKISSTNIIGTGIIFVGLYIMESSDE